MRLNDRVEEAWEKFKREAEQHGAQTDWESEAVYTHRDPISETWDTKNKLVRLDDAIMALHIMAARHSFRGISKVYQKFLVKVTEFVTQFLTAWGARKLLGKVVGRAALGQLAGTIAGTIEETVFQRQLEESIRTASFEVRADLFREPMKANPKRPRKTKVVFTRHAPAPKQRRPNQSWHSPKSRR